MTLTLGFSPCPNDTFIFDALVNAKIDTEGLSFEVQLADVQTLNNKAIGQQLDVSKISYGVLPLITPNYAVLGSGGALGMGVGPLLIAMQPLENLADINKQTIAIPGENTTAHLLFSMAFPKAVFKQFMVFSDIETAVLTGKADAGVIIHENRFTYQDKGLVKLMDLGAYWEEKTLAPIPLGGIVMKKHFSLSLMQKVNRLINKSVAYSFEHYPQLSDYITSHAQEMDEAVMRLHIDLYVNNYSLSLGESGKQAVNTLLKVYKEMHHLADVADVDFVL